MLDYSQETEKQAAGYSVIAGVDEVGRGPWAGPVVTCAVVLKPQALAQLTLLNDSKKLTARQREALYATLMVLAEKGAVNYALAEASVEEIDQINIREATHLAMRRAVQGLSEKADFTFIDGHEIPRDFPTKAECVIKGDGKVMSIAAASIIAKVYRDKMMGELHNDYPYYNWASNAGYGTKDHQNGLASHGVTPHHRQSFAPIRKLMEAAQ